MEINTEDHIHDEKLISKWVERFVGAVVSLLPLEESLNEEGGPLQGFPEGAKDRVAVNRYERSRINRALCIESQGCACKACGFDFEKKYGAIGAGFIHVHHLTPVSKLGEDYVVDPINDLVPVCPNCHSMLHKKEPPISIAQLKKLMKSTGGS